MRHGVFRPSQDSWATQFCICIDESSLCPKRKTMWQAQSFCCLSEDCLRTPPPSRFFSRSVILSFFLEMKRIASAPRFCLRNTDVKEPLVGTVIPLLKPWAELYPDTPDAITITPPAPRSRRRRTCGFVSSTTLRRIQKGQNGAALRFPEVARMLHRFLPRIPRNSTRSGFLEASCEERGWRGALRATRGRIYWISLSVKCLSATCNLKDCSTDALYLCINYAKWPNQLPFSSSAWRARLRMHRLIPLPFSREERAPPPCSRFSFLSSAWKNEAEWLWTFHFCSVRLLRFCTAAQTRFGILKDHRCFSYFSWFVICCKCCKTVGLKKKKRKKNCLQYVATAIFLERLVCRARFCKGFAVLTFDTCLLQLLWIIKTLLTNASVRWVKGRALSSCKGGDSKWIRSFYWEITKKKKKNGTCRWPGGGVELHGAATRIHSLWTEHQLDLQLRAGTSWIRLLAFVHFKTLITADARD